MAIARNRKKEPDAAAIAAFGAAAEPRIDTPPAVEDVTRPSEGPKGSLVRWAGEEDLRDALIQFGKLNRYNMQELMIEAMRRGLAEMSASKR